MEIEGNKWKEKKLDGNSQKYIDTDRYRWKQMYRDENKQTLEVMDGIHGNIRKQTERDGNRCKQMNIDGNICKYIDVNKKQMEIDRND